VTRTGTRGRAVAASAVALLVTAASAHGATISAEPYCPDTRSGCTPIVAYDGAPGEANEVTVEPRYSTVVVRDTGALLTAGRGCRQEGEHGAQCDLAGFSVYELGDGNDRFTGAVDGDVLLGPGDDVLDGAVDDVSGGPGDDVMLNGTDVTRWLGDEGNDTMSATGPDADLEGGPGNDDVEGGDGNEILNGGPGADTVSGLGGNDLLIGDDRRDRYAPPAVPAADSLDGGDGADLVAYTLRTEPVTVDLSADGPSGAAGEGDRLTSIEGASGGGGDDRLTGDDGANVLLGGPGADVLEGRAGRDILAGAEGLDRLSAGRGNDVIAASTGYGFGLTGSPAGSPGLDADMEAIDCGPGLDAVESADYDVPDADCETAVFKAGYYDAKFTLTPVDAGPRAATFAVPCPRPLRVKGRCAGRLSLLGDGQRRRSFVLPKAGGSVTVSRPPGKRVLLTLRYRAHPVTDYAYTYGVSVYLDLPPADESAPPVAMG
jgi:hypothetical protein